MTYFFNLVKEIFLFISSMFRGRKSVESLTGLPSQSGNDLLHKEQSTPKNNGLMLILFGQ
jgi:hypothetical protein